MALTVEQIKGRLRNIAKQNNADARVLIRIYMMERFLERVSVSKYADNFIIKGGILVTSMVGVACRSTMDIDTSIKGYNLSEEEAKNIVDDISGIDLGDNVCFRIHEVSTIMDDMEYPGIRISLDAVMGKMITPIKIDISTGDIITPNAIEYTYKLMLEERSIKLWSYNLETILAEKMQTVLVRGILNTRMRDLYDIHMLLTGYSEQIDGPLLGRAFISTCTKRNSLYLVAQGMNVIEAITVDKGINSLWNAYQRRYLYAADISYKDVIHSVKRMFNIIESVI